MEACCRPLLNSPTILIDCCRNISENSAHDFCEFANGVIATLRTANWGAELGKPEGSDASRPFSCLCGIYTDCVPGTRFRFGSAKFRRQLTRSVSLGSGIARAENLLAPCRQLGIQRFGNVARRQQSWFGNHRRCHGFGRRDDLSASRAGELLD